MKSRDHHAGDAAGRAGAAIANSPGRATAGAGGGRYRNSPRASCHPVARGRAGCFPAVFPALPGLLPRAVATPRFLSAARNGRAFGSGSFFVNSLRVRVDGRCALHRSTRRSARCYIDASPDGGGRARTNFLRLKPASDAAQDFAKGLKTSVWLACRHDRQPRRMNAPVRAQVVPIGGKSHAGRS